MNTEQTGQQEDSSKATGDSSSSTKQLVIKLTPEKVKPLETGMLSPILQVDGLGEDVRKQVKYSFMSNYGEEDIVHSFSEYFQKVW